MMSHWLPLPQRMCTSMNDDDNERHHNSSAASANPSCNSRIPIVSVVAAVASVIAAGISAWSAVEASKEIETQRKRNYDSISFDFSQEKDDLLICQKTGNPYPLKKLDLSPGFKRDDEMGLGDKQTLEVNKWSINSNTPCVQHARLENPLTVVCRHECTGITFLLIEFTLYDLPRSTDVLWDLTAKQ